MAKPASVEAYLDALPEDRRAAMEQLRAAIRAEAPEAEEVITYDMPGFRLDGRFFVSYASFKRHISLFPASQGVIEGLGEAIAPHLAGKGTIRFDADRPLPIELIRRIVAIRLEEHRSR
jgi:uncharacterized protein YdhG (YjbR/CyaY superfamily)